MNHKPPNEEGGADDAARSELTDPAIIVDEFRNINRALPSFSMISEGWRLLDQWGNTGTSEALLAFCRHVNGLRSRMKAAIGNQS
jgi:hypothetical protein